MAFTNSSLISMTRISPNRNSPRNNTIKKIVIHHMAGVCSIEQFGNIVANPAREMSANYGIGNDGRIILTCPESDRSWCSSSGLIDNQSITIEVSNSAYGDASGWPVSDAAYNSLIKLCVDICKRNGIKKLEYINGSTSGTLVRHCDIVPTACLPIDRTELLTPNGWKLLKDINFDDKVATVHVDNLGIWFDDIENIVPVKTQDTYTIRDLEATSDHRIMYFNNNGRQYVSQFKDIYDRSGTLYIPNAGYINTSTRLPISDDEMELLVAVQADGHYMKDGKCRYGIEFHFSKERKIKRIKKLLNRLEIEYKVCKQTNGTTKIRIYGKRYVKFCEDFLNEKQFTWDWINMSNQQALHFLDVILEYDGCRANLSYSSYIKSNIDIVQAIAATHGFGSKLGDNHTRIYFKKEKRSLGECKKKRRVQQQVSCVTVRSGFILIRQHGRTTIVGNCPGPWIKNHTTDICNKVNAQLNSTPTPTPTPQPSTSYTVSLKASDLIYETPGGKQSGTVGANGTFTIVEDKWVSGTKYGKLKSGAGWVVVAKANNNQTTFRVGDLVYLKSDAVYYNGAGIPEWVKRDRWYISSISNDRAVLGQNASRNRDIQSPVNTKYLTKDASNVNTTESIKVGDWVKVTNNVIYGTNNKFVVYASKYKVLELKGERAVISSDGKNVTTAISINNIQKV